MWPRVALYNGFEVEPSSSDLADFDCRFAIKSLPFARQHSIDLCHWCRTAATY